MSDYVNIPISDRIKTLTLMVTKGNSVCDVGCDHGFTSIYLVKNNISPFAIASDVRPGPLSAAAQNIERYGLRDKIQTLLSDGLKGIDKPLDTLIIAGMGGPLMEKILSFEPEKSKGFKELILQPQSDITGFRRFLISAGYSFIDEKAVFEDGKYYFAMKVVPEEFKGEYSEAQYEFGPVLLKNKDGVLKDYIGKRIKTVSAIEENISSKGNTVSRERFEEIQKEKAFLLKTLVEL
ncbi:MAG: class I SAM-dependent methyltransferase [Lachnospiraceae bacterium]|nr:class I SAM-dependent methyltransferase [Lachnospiraceae bacterium]